MINDPTHSEQRHQVVINGHDNRWCVTCHEWAYFDFDPFERDPDAEPEQEAARLRRIHTGDF